MLYVIIAFLLISLLFYILFGGADFGAGIIEIFTKRNKKHLITHAIGPVWEANHIWLILIVVILFMGFPAIYSKVSLYLHIPLLILLVGIILRGTAFTFRHYDAFEEEKSQHIYSLIFRFSSVLTPVFLGVTAGAMMLGRIPGEGSGDFYSSFIWPWWNIFSFSTGIFTAILFSFLASIYLIGETTDEDRKFFISLSLKLNILAVIAGAFVFFAGGINDFNLFESFFGSPVSIIAMVLASIALVFLWISTLKGKVILTRIFAGFQVLMILGAWIWIRFPVLITLREGEGLTFFNTSAPEATQVQLMWALLVGSLFILPSLYFLMRTFKSKVAGS